MKVCFMLLFLIACGKGKELDSVSTPTETQMADVMPRADAAMEENGRNYGYNSENQFYERYSQEVDNRYMERYPRYCNWDRSSRRRWFKEEIKKKRPYNYYCKKWDCRKSYRESGRGY